MNPKDDHLETKMFEEVLIESIKMTAKLNFQDSMQFYLTNWLSLSRTNQENEFVYAQGGKLLAECGRSEWVAALFDKGQNSDQPSPPPAKRQMKKTLLRLPRNQTYRISMATSHLKV